MANEKNLVSLKDRTQRERNEIAKKGAAAANKKKKEQKTYRELARVMLSAKVNNDEAEAIAEQFGIKNLDVKTLTLLGMIRAAANGSYNAFDRLMTLVGEDVPTDDNASKQNKLLKAIEKAVRDAD